MDAAAFAELLAAATDAGIDAATASVPAIWRRVEALRQLADSAASVTAAMKERAGVILSLVEGLSKLPGGQGQELVVKAVEALMVAGSGGAHLGGPAESGSAAAPAQATAAPAPPSKGRAPKEVRTAECILSSGAFVFEAGAYLPVTVLRNVVRGVAAHLGLRAPPVTAAAFDGPLGNRGLSLEIVRRTKEYPRGSGDKHSMRIVQGLDVSPEALARMGVEAIPSRLTGARDEKGRFILRGEGAPKSPKAAAAPRTKKARKAAKEGEDGPEAEDGPRKAARAEAASPSAPVPLQTAA